jgi:hypothetical protein
MKFAEERIFVTMELQDESGGYGSVGWSWESGIDFIYTYKAIYCTPINRTHVQSLYEERKQDWEHTQYRVNLTSEFGGRNYKWRVNIHAQICIVIQSNILIIFNTNARGTNAVIKTIFCLNIGYIYVCLDVYIQVWEKKVKLSL